MIKITLPDGTIKEFAKNSTPMDVAKSISEGFARNVISANFNDITVETTTPLTTDGSLILYTFNDDGGKKAFWHSSAHVLAEAILSFHPNAKLTIGPAIDNGFYYDIDLDNEVISDKDFKQIETKFLEIARGKHEFSLRSVSKAEALELYKKENNPYKIELIENLTDGEITFCDHSNFTDLCRGGHVPNTGIIKAIKIMSVAGAYWRGDEKNNQLTRVYGISFPKQKLLTEYLELLEEAKKRDHRKLGKELELFTFSPKVGQGLPLWLPKGAALRSRLQDFLKVAQKKAGYQEVMTPHIGQKELYVTSGHYEKYGEDSFQAIRTPKMDEEFLLKPMNCPHHCEIYKTKPWSYRDLPKRYAEFGTVYRYEKSGVIHGLTRARGFTQDDAHIYCTKEQMVGELDSLLTFVLNLLRDYGLEDFYLELSTRNPEKSVGEDSDWAEATEALRKAALAQNLELVLDEGGAAFYGPKISVQAKDAIGRTWQMSTIQVDFQLPQRFELEYSATDGTRQRPVMIHRALFGSIERFFGVLTEHYSGAFPPWLAPVQVTAIPVAEAFADYLASVVKEFKAAGIRIDLDASDDRMQKKIRNAQMQKVPYMLIAGEEDQQAGKVSIRYRNGEQKNSISIADAIAEIKLAIAERKQV